MVTYAGFWRNDNMDYGQRGLPNKCPFFEFEGFSIFKRNIFGQSLTFQTKYFRRNTEFSIFPFFTNSRIFT